MSGQYNMFGHPIQDLDTPILLVDLDKLERNIETMRRVIISEAGIDWRPHTKGIKIPALAHKLLQAGACGVTCAKLSEAEVMVAAGIRDILIANQVVGASKIRRLVNLIHHADVIVAVDCEEHLTALNDAALEASSVLKVVIEVNMGINRAGVAPGKPVVSLAKQIVAYKGLKFAGIMGWEGHTARIRNPDEKKKAIEEAVNQFTASSEICVAAGIPVKIVSCGGTGTYWITSKMQGVTEVQAGGGIFCDLNYRKNFGVMHEYALTILTTVISRPTPSRIICDAGWKSMSEYLARPEPLDLGEIKKLKLGSEHTSIELSTKSSVPRVGDKVEFVPGWSDTTIFLHDHLYGVRSGRLEVIWPIWGRGKTM
ncbi:MAG: DSD1 family PLP-dependent enzyme [Desulfobacterales bacterium]|nr:MAG: DSD1 family PLP-dependent enzyme [Desulfobacterales bacterium]